MQPLQHAGSDRKARAGDRGRSRRYPRWVKLGATGIALIAALLATGGAGATGRGAAAKKIEAVTSLLRGIPQEKNRLGDPNAPVTLAMFGDLECPSCRYVALYTLPTIIRRFVRTGKLKIEYHSFESATIEPAVFQKQQVAALAAGEQDKMWYFVELFYHEQGREYTNYVNESYLDGLARQVPGLNVAAWMAARSNPELTAQVESDAEVGTSDEWETTPDFFLGRGSTLSSFHPTSARPSSFAGPIKALLRTR